MSEYEVGDYIKLVKDIVNPQNNGSIYKIVKVIFEKSIKTRFFCKVICNL